VLVYDTDTTPILMVTLNYAIFSKLYRCWHVSVLVVVWYPCQSGIRVSVCVS